MKINIQYIPQNAQRYNTLGDWYYREGVLEIRATEFDNRTYSLLIAIHELAEAVLCEALGITEKEVDKWDFAYEDARDKGGEQAPCGQCPILEEPGDDIHCPCHVPHVVASVVERLAAHALGINWSLYEETLSGDDEHMGPWEPRDHE